MASETHFHIPDGPFDAQLRFMDGASRVGVIVLGGSLGGIAEHGVRWYAEGGFPALGVAYFGTTNTPDHLNMIPLEYFDAPISWFRSNSIAPIDSLAIVGHSRGSELALLLASTRSDVDAVIATMPSGVVFQGAVSAAKPESAWSIGGDPVPYVRYPQGYEVPTNRHDRNLYVESMKQYDMVNRATIPVERIRGPVLLISGAQDLAWPSTEFAERIISRLTHHQFPHSYKHISYLNAGHTLNEWFMVGGTEAGNREARLGHLEAAFSLLRSLESPSR
ncbi:MAG: acyl-CoA thioester hydrolase/BAAT C-terminal domain-containing protein [Pseudomonadota bacterium]